MKIAELMSQLFFDFLMNVCENAKSEDIISDLILRNTIFGHDDVFQVSNLALQFLTLMP